MLARALTIFAIAKTLLELLRIMFAMAKLKTNTFNCIKSKSTINIFPFFLLHYSYFTIFIMKFFNLLKFTRMKKQLVFLVIYTSFLAASCNSGGKEKNEPTPADEASSTTNNSNEKNGVEAKNARWEMRKAKDDTLAMPYKDLQAYLPEISGYTKTGGPKGSQMNLPGMGSWSEAEQEYGAADKMLSLKIVDYNAAWQAFQGITAIYSMGFSTEDDTKKQAQADMGIKDVNAYQTTYKTEKKSELVLVVGERFYITLESDGENSESFLKDIAKNMKLDKLAAM